MNNTEKLLRAFIEASGFDIEEVETFNEAQYLVDKEDYKNNPNDYRGAFCKSPPFKASYIEIDYKVTKKPDQLNKLYDGISLRQLTQNVIDIECDPLSGFKFIKYPKDSFHAVIDWFAHDAKRVDDHTYYVLSVEVSLDVDL